MLKKDPETAKAEDDRSIWILSDGKAGDEIQCMGVAEALGRPYQIRRVAPRRPFVWAMPWGPIDPREAETRPGSPLAPPYPDIAIASGRRTVPYLRRLKKLSGGRTFTVFLKDPRTGTKTADLIWVGEHDRLRGANVLVTPTAPHRHSAVKLAAARAQPDPRLGVLPSPRIAVLVGGNSRHHTFTPEDISRFADGLADAARQGGSLMITASRRTPPALNHRLEQLAETGNHFLWDGSGENPLLAMLALADTIVVTGDSTNMVGEALAAGRPVHVFMPSGGHHRLDLFLTGLRQIGAIHPFPGPLKTTTCEPLDSTPQIAAAIRDRLASRKA